MRRNLSIVFLALALGCVLTACNGDREEILSIGTNVWPGYEPLYLARSLGCYPKDSVKLVEFSSSTEVSRGLRNGAIEGAAMTLDEALLLASQNVDLRVVLVLDYSHGADVILGGPGLTGIGDIRGKKVGVENTSCGAYMLSRALEISGIGLDEVTIIPLESSEHEASYTRKKVDALVTYEPVQTRLVKAGARILFDSTRIPGEVVDVLVVRRDCLDKQARHIETLTRCWYRALDYLRGNPRDAASRIAPRMGLSPDEALESLNRLLLVGRHENQGMLDGPRPTLPATAERLASFMKEQRLLFREVNVKSLFTEGK
jgi:NitT/TauT family transport system substrate-binding protein